jgi:hypothetical protein
MNEEIFLKTVLNMIVKVTSPRGRQASKWEQQVRRDVTRKEFEHRKKLQRGVVGRQTDGDLILRRHT